MILRARDVMNVTCRRIVSHATQAVPKKCAALHFFVEP